jgi:hypothetical protein
MRIVVGRLPGGKPDSIASCSTNFSRKRERDTNPRHFCLNRRQIRDADGEADKHVVDALAFALDGVFVAVWPSDESAAGGRIGQYRQDEEDA